MITWLTEFADMLSWVFVVVAAILTLAMALVVAAGALWVAWRLVTRQSNRIIQRLADQHTLAKVQLAFSRERAAQSNSEMEDLS